MEKVEKPTESKLIIIWNKVPLIVRAIIIGLFVSTLGVLSWGVMATFVPMPWAFMLEIGVLWLFWKYFSGSWSPNSTKSFRKDNFRSIKLPSKKWGLALFAALLIVTIEQSGLIVTFRLMPFPAEQFTEAYSFLANVPTWAAWLVVIMISIVAGISEEIGFRGYMQKPLERKYGPIIGITIVSLMFVLVHLHQAWSGPIIFHIFFISVLFGSVAYFSGSLIPGIIGHIIMDIFNFSFWWSTLGSQFDRLPIGETGMDYHFVLWSTVLVISVVAFILTLPKLKSNNEVSSNSQSLLNLEDNALY